MGVVGGVALTAERGDILLAVTLDPDYRYLGGGGILRPGERAGGRLHASPPSWLISWAGRP